MSGLAVLPVLFGVIAVGAVIGGLVLERKRRERLMLWCLNRGWTYVAEDPTLVDRWSGDPFRQGDRRRARNVITGTGNGRPFVAFDYTYDTHSTDSNGNRQTTTHRYSICAVALPAHLSTLQVTPEGALHRMAGAIGLGNDIDLESEDFNRRFTVHADNRKFASDVLAPRTMEYLLSVPPVAWRIEGSTMLRWASGRMKPEAVIEATAVLDRVADSIPAFVWKDHGYDPRP